MRALFTFLAVPFFMVLLLSCSDNGQPFAYTGRADVDTVMVSSQAAGVIESLSVQEGQAVHKDEVLGGINTDRLAAQRRQQLAQLGELQLRRAAAKAQIAQAQAQLELSRETLGKTENLLAQGGATQQRRDELRTQVQVEQANLEVLQANYELVGAQEEVLRKGIDITDIAIRDARIVSPINGEVLNRFHRTGELATVGTPLVEVADLSVMTVEIYVPLPKLASFTVGTPAAIIVQGGSRQLSGTVSWISSRAEFTPKSILTEETRTTLVYGVKIRVPNPDGILKIGMPVDVRL
jgi:HlyD family secretion protein